MWGGLGAYDGLGLAKAGFCAAAAEGNRTPGYDSRDLLKLYIYGYLNRVRSSRPREWLGMGAIVAQGLWHSHSAKGRSFY